MLEEAYNQEAGVVQHILSVVRDHKANAWSLNLAQEWPLWGQTHQFSYDLPLEHANGLTRLGDISINYRYQALGIENHDVALAPRFSLIISTSEQDDDIDTKGVGLSLGLPLSLKVGSFALHTNAELVIIPKATFSSGYATAISEVNLGQSVVWLIHPKFNALVEGLWSRSSYQKQNGDTHSEEMYVINPGIRWAHDFDSGLQIVPGISMPITIGDESSTQIFVYLSLEHNF